MKIKKTARGFQFIEFKDRSGALCSLQQSSAADYRQPGSSAIWIGPDSADPKILVPGEGWKPVDFPEGTSFTTRAHLSYKQVKSIVRHLQCWLETGYFNMPRKIKERPNGEA